MGPKAIFWGLVLALLSFVIPNHCEANMDTDLDFISKGENTIPVQYLGGMLAGYFISCGGTNIAQVDLIKNGEVISGFNYIFDPYAIKSDACSDMVFDSLLQMFAKLCDINTVSETSWDTFTHEIWSDSPKCGIVSQVVADKAEMTGEIVCRGGNYLFAEITVKKNDIGLRSSLRKRNLKKGILTATPAYYKAMGWSVPADLTTAAK